MVQSLLAILVIHSQGVGPDVALQRAITFRNFVASGSAGNGLRTSLSEQASVEESDSRVHIIRSQNWQVIVDRATGNIRGFSIFGAEVQAWDYRWQPAIAISPERCRELALAYFHAAGWEEDGLLFRVVKPAAEEFNNKTQEAVWSIEAQRVHNGVTIDWRHPVMLDLEPTTGQLAEFIVDGRGSELGEPGVPTVSIATARERMVAEVFRRFHVGTLEESMPMYLCAFDPSPLFYDESDFSSPIAVQAFRQGRVLLAWDCLVRITDGPRQRWTRVVVHAHSGQLLYIEEGGGSFGAHAPSKATVPFRWDWGVGPTEVLARGSAWSTPSGDVENLAGAPPRSSSARWKPVILRRARLLVSAEFDAASGLLRTRGGARPAYGGPNRSLLKILRSAVGG